MYVDSGRYFETKNSTRVPGDESVGIPSRTNTQTHLLLADLRFPCRMLLVLRERDVLLDNLGQPQLRPAGDRGGHLPVHSWKSQGQRFRHGSETGKRAMMKTCAECGMDTRKKYQTDE